MFNQSMWFALWAGLALKSTLVLCAAWWIAFVLRRRSAALRHLIWTAAGVSVLALPFFSIGLPAFEIPSIQKLAPGVASLFETTATTLSDTPAPNTPAHPASAIPQRTGHRPLDWRLLLLSIWSIGVAVALAQILIAFAAMYRVRRSATLSPARPLATQLAAQLGISHPVDVLETPAGFMPMTCGIFRPAIFLPSDAAGWTEDRLRMVLLHELAHVRRADVATHLAARLALSLNWWNPLAWIAWREFLKERERATDDLVLQSGARASEYAGHLLDVARAMQSPAALAGATVAMARRSQLEGRLVAILDSRLNRKTPGRASALIAALVAVVIAAPFAALRAQGQSSPAVLADVDATIRAASAQKNFQMLEKPADELEALGLFDPAKKLLDADLAIRADVAGTRSVEYGVGLMKLADLEKKRNLPKIAEQFYTQAAQVLGNRPEAAPALIYMGVTMIAAKNYQQATEYFQSGQNLDSTQAGRAQMWMALVLERQQNPAEAEVLYQKALALDAADSDDAATTLELEARLLASQGREDEAKPMADRASEIRKSLGMTRVKSTALHISGGVSAPKVLSKVEPQYTEEARVAKYQGTAVLSVEIGPDGLAHNIQITRGLGFGLDLNAVSAVRQWRFQPATKDAAPVTVQATIEVNFRLL